MTKLKAAYAKVRLFYDPTREPLRRRVYTAIALILAVTTPLGLITGTMAVTITGIASSVLMGAVAEQIRTLVTPVAAPVLDEPLVDDDPGAHAAPEDSA